MRAKNQVIASANSGGVLVLAPAMETQVPPLTEYDVAKGFTYMYVKGEPLYPFGYGLSYTQFDYSNLQVSPERLNHCHHER